MLGAVVTLAAAVLWAVEENALEEVNLRAEWSARVALASDCIIT